MIKYLTCEQGFQEKQQWSSDCWINVTCPTDEEVNYLIEKKKVPESFLKDIADIEERPRIEYEGEWRLTILRVPLRTEDGVNPFITVPMGFILKDDIFISVCYHQTEMIEDFILHSQRKKYINKKRNDLLMHLFLSSTIWYLKYLKQISQQIRDAEDLLEQSIRNAQLLRLMKLERTLVYFTTSIRANEILQSKLKSLHRQTDDHYDEELLEDVNIELQQAHNSANVQSDILAGMMDSFASIISNNLNIIMKRLTSVSIILMIPTLIASFYGMNVPNSLGENPHGFAIISVVSISFSMFALLFFKHRRWL